MKGIEHGYLTSGAVLLYVFRSFRLIEKNQKIKGAPIALPIGIGTYALPVRANARVRGRVFTVLYTDGAVVLL